MLDSLSINNLFDLNETIAAELFAGCAYPWEVLPKISQFILDIGPLLPETKYERLSDRIWISRAAKIFASAYIEGPCIIDDEAEIRHCAFIRGNAIIGKRAVVGNSTEVKNSILFNKVQVPHFNYVGDSILGYMSHMGAGSITSNVKSDKTIVHVKRGDTSFDTGLKKFGAMLGDFVEVGCNSVLCPGTVVGRNTTIYPTSCVRGAIPENSIFKDSQTIVTKRTKEGE